MGMCGRNLLSLATVSYFHLTAELQHFLFMQVNESMLERGLRLLQKNMPVAEEDRDLLPDGEKWFERVYKNREKLWPGAFKPVREGSNVLSKFFSCAFCILVHRLLSGVVSFRMPVHP